MIEWLSDYASNEMLLNTAASLLIAFIAIVAMLIVKTKAQKENAKARATRFHGRKVRIDPDEVVSGMIDYVDARNKARGKNTIKNGIAHTIADAAETASENIHSGSAYGHRMAAARARAGILHDNAETKIPYPIIRYASIDNAGFIAREANDCYAPDENKIMLNIAGTDAEEGEEIYVGTNAERELAMTTGAVAVLCHEAGHFCQSASGDPRLSASNVLDMLATSMGYLTLAVALAIVLLSGGVTATAVAPLVTYTALRTIAAGLRCSYEKDASDDAKEFLRTRLRDRNLRRAYADSKILDRFYVSYKADCAMWLLATVIVAALAFALEALALA